MIHMYMGKPVVSGEVVAYDDTALQMAVASKFGAENFNSEQFTVENNVVSLAGGGDTPEQLSTPIAGSNTTSLVVYRTGNVVSFTAIVPSMTSNYVVATDMPTPVSNMAFIPVNGRPGTSSTGIIYTNGSCWISDDGALTYHGSYLNNFCMITGIYICK